MNVPLMNYRALYEPFIVTTSCLDNIGKREMKQLMMTLGGHVVNEWRKDCTLLVMSELSVTVKVWILHRYCISHTPETRAFIYAWSLFCLWKMHVKWLIVQGKNWSNVPIFDLYTKYTASHIAFLVENRSYWTEPQSNQSGGRCSLMLEGVFFLNAV